jgi:hypothetical protein
MKLVNLKLQELTLDPSIQSRTERDEAYVEELRKDLLEGAEFPPIVVFTDGNTSWPADGVHRYLAHERAGRSEILADLREGGKREAIFHAVGANAKHGKRRSNEDKRKAVEILLQDEEWGKWSDRHIANACRVSQPLVSSIRKDLAENGHEFKATRVCSDGREMDVSQIGSNRDQESPQTEASVGAASEDVQDEAGTTEAQANPEVPTPENTETQSTQNGSTEARTDVEDRESLAPGEGGNTQRVEPEAAKVPTVKEVRSGSGEAIALSESGLQPDGPVLAETSPQESGRVNQVQEDGATHPDEPNYPDDPGVLKQLLVQEKAEIVKLQGELRAKDQLIEKLLTENANLKEEVEYLREQLTEDTTV